ncbi:acyltransferase family protein [Microbacterium proteolyticum]|uniref:acyltransferase family protein n=1 Tax=Microbacterium proteolyticum TaxID=1572644 RepID=UPI001FAB74F8|nr:acyltransferase family protein [Microbacterium proteolyticum]MCI9857103.1 acyltransferase family protein [Microbacterium proteolyticum]
MKSTAAKSMWLRDDVGRRDWIDVVKGVAIIMIVAYHVSLFLNSLGMDAAGVGRARIILDLFPMPAFFLISGLFHNRISGWSFADLWRRRLRQYLYLYVLWSVLRFLFYLVVPNVRADGAGASASDPLALLGILVWPISSYWFIYALFVFTLVLWLFRSVPPWVLVALALVASTLMSAGLISTGNVGWNRMIEYFVFFVIGAAFHRWIHSTVERTTPVTIVLSIAAFAAFAAAATLIPRVASIPGVAFLGQVLVVVAGFALATQVTRLKPLSWISYIGIRSLNIYLVHIFVIALIALPLSPVARWLDTLPGRGLIVILVVTAIVTALSIFVTRYLTRVSWLFVYPFGRSSAARTARAQKRSA